MFTSEMINQLKQDLDQWYDDAVEDCENGQYEGEWYQQLKSVFDAAYGINAY